MRLPIIIVSCLSFLSALSAVGQSLTGTVANENNEALPFANVLLLQPNDSSLVKGTVTDQAGTYQLRDLPAGSFLLSATSIGYQPVYRSVNLQEDQTVDFSLSESTTELEAVEVTAQRPLYEQQVDRMVVNVENSVTAAGSSALEILERSPGVVVNRQNSVISLVGKEGVLVMINGKINYMPVEAVMQMLAGMSADNIAQIELITNPPAKYDAEGNAGMINIVLKEQPDQGLNGVFSVSGGYGRGAVGAANLNLNYRQGRVNLYGNYSYLLNQQEGTADFFRQITTPGQLAETTIDFDRFPEQQNHSLRIGLDYQLTPKTVVGFLVNGYNNTFTLDGDIEGSIVSSQAADTTFVRLVDERNQWRHLAGNINITHSFAEGKTLSLNADYLRYDNENPIDYITDYFNKEGQLLFNERINSDKNTPLDILVGALDYSHRVSEPVRLEAGIKAVNTSLTNKVAVVAQTPQNTLPPEDLNGTADLAETILAAYTSLDHKISERTELTAGLRYEYTDTNLSSDERADIVDRQYGNLFPTATLSHTLNEKNQLTLAYNRRITRPTFNDIAPFFILLSPNTYYTGNPALQPAISDAVSFRYRRNSWLLTLQYSYEDSTIARFQDQIIAENNQQAIASLNMDNTQVFSTQLTFPIYVTDWWEMQNNVLLLHQQINTFYPPASGIRQPLQINQWGVQGNTTQTFLLPYDFTAEITGFYQSDSYVGTARFKPIGGLNVGLQKKLKNNAGTLRFNVTDLFNSIVRRRVTDLPEQNAIANGRLDFSQRTFRLTYSRSFGNQKLRGARQRSTGSDTERGRVE